MCESTNKIIKFPRTPHLEGSRLQDGDYDLSQISFSKIKDKYLVIEEKIDGANCGISYSDDGELLLQSRGHYLRGGVKERDFDLFKQWGVAHQDALFATLGNRYIMYGEWMFVKHKIFYDLLPHYFIEFDIFDKENNVFLSTERRKELTSNLPIVSVPVLAKGVFKSKKDVLALLKNSLYKSEKFSENLVKEAVSKGVEMETVLKNTDTSPLMEGLYIKIEEEGVVKDRLKFVRHSYTQSAVDDDTPWLNRTIINNKLNCELSDLFK